MADKNKQAGKAWLNMDNDQIELVKQFNEGYLGFLNRVKTEREAVKFITEKASQKGFQSLEQIEKIDPGQKILVNIKNKAAALLIMGEKPLSEGFNLVVSHIDTPRIDLKANPLYETDGLALFKTHYYGGIKKYHWVAIPLALNGVVYKKDGTEININIGFDEADPVLTIADLLPHLAKEQMEKKMAEVITGEKLTPIVGSSPLSDGDNPVKEIVLQFFKEKYDIDEADFTSAELQLVPAIKASETGLDRSMVGAYGHDDRVSAYASLQAALEVENPDTTALCLFVDKEEIGSTGNTGLQSILLENLIVEIMHLNGPVDYFAVRKCLANSHALSADVNAAVDPNYPEVFEKDNCSFLGNGVVLTKYTGSRGKAESNDANPEFLSQMRKLFDDNGVVWQTGELGKVDIGGGGTVAQYISHYGMEVVDCGVAVLGMHSPFEVVSKADVLMSYKAYRAFMQSF
ncbi:MAG TPA: aminopeptidase [Syntrophomonadaceae bacterium]|nr:aminopeptidase [Syntrophomonadaceae bacterium]HPR93407.1 aminopeptidase [Syntrophomonadaceae bacterium]